MPHFENIYDLVCECAFIFTIIRLPGMHNANPQSEGRNQSLHFTSPVLRMLFWSHFKACLLGVERGNCNFLHPKPQHLLIQKSISEKNDYHVSGSDF